MAPVKTSARAAWRMVRLVMRSLAYLVMMRAAFPLALRILLVIGAIQVPVLPFDEIAALIAAAWLLARYRPTLRVAYRAAQLDTIETI